MTLLSILIYLAAASVIIVCVSLEVEIIRRWIIEYKAKQTFRALIKNAKENE
jgi:hypothetical protein